MSGGNDEALEVEKLPKFAVEVSREAKLKELLRNLASLEIKLYSDAAKEFIKLLRSDAGGELLHEYIQTSSKCIELLQVWKLRQGKPDLSYLLSLISAILSHPDGLYKEGDRDRISISRALDKFARLIIEEKLVDVCKELNSKEAKSQNAALLLLASIVRRGSGLASDVAKCFDFKLPVFTKLAEYKRKKVETKRKHFTREAFVGFAMSFLEVGKPGLMRWIIQKKEMYSGVLCGLGSDDDDTVVYVLSTLRDRILIPESGIPPSLRSVLFGSVTLDQLISISGREDGGDAAELAHAVLIKVCTDPVNGLMPDLNRHPNPLRGNLKRLSDVMKKLQATEVDNHRDLLLAIVRGRPSFGSLYMDEFPYNLEDHASPSWFHAMSLAASLISSVGSGCPFAFLESYPDQPPSLNNPDVQSIIRCVCPRPFTRSVVNKGLYHANSLVKHGTLRLVLESLRLLDSFISTIERNICSSNQLMLGWVSLKQDIQNEVRILLPDPQVLRTLLSSFSSHYKSPNSCMKRPADSDGELECGVNAVKKLKTGSQNMDVDILVSGVCLSDDTALLGDTEHVDEFNYGDELMTALADIWGLKHCSMHYGTEEDEQILLYTNLLDAVKIYHRTVPAALEGAFDVFKLLPANPLALPTILQQSLLSLLIQLVGWSARSNVPIRTPAKIYTHLQLFLNLLLYSTRNDIKDQAQVLARAAMLSTGAFDRNVDEIGVWFLFLPGFGISNSSLGEQGYEVFQNLFSVVVSFLCDAVSTTGNNLFKYWGLLRLHTYQLKNVEDVAPKFSPLIICALEKCLRLLTSDSGNFTLPEKSMISLYVCNTIKYLLQTQEEVGLLSSLVDALISERVMEHCSLVDNDHYLCEWRPLKNLLLFARSIERQESCTFCSERTLVHADSSFASMLAEVEKVLSGNDSELVGVTKAFILSTLSTSPAAVAEHFPSVVCIFQLLSGAPYSLLFSIIFLEPKLLDNIQNTWPEMFFTGLEKVVAMIENGDKNEESIDDKDAGRKGSVSAAFCSFLMQAPFHVLFPAIIGTNGPCLQVGSKQLDFLQAKLSQESTDDSRLNLRLMLFWFHQIQLSYRIKPSAKLEQLCETCYILIEKLLAPMLVKPNFQLQSSQDHSPTHHLMELAEIILFHPVVMMSLESPLDTDENFVACSCDSLENFLGSVKQGVHKMDHYVFNLLRGISESLQSFCNCELFAVEVDCGGKSLVKSIQALVKKLDTTFKERFEYCIKTENWTPLLPALYTLHILFRFISPLELLELARWVFSIIDLRNCKLPVRILNFALSVGLWIAGCAFDMLSAYFQLPSTGGISYSTFWGQKDMIFDALLFEDVYFQALEIAMLLELELADLCVLKAFNVASICKVTRNQRLHLCTDISKVILNTPLKVLSHCMQKSGTTRTKMLFLLTELSPFHLLGFGQLFSSMRSSYLLPKGDLIEEKCKFALSDDVFVMLLPTVCSYVRSSSVMLGKHSHQCIRDISSFYYSILLRNFVEWKSYVSRDIFLVECTESFPSSAEELLNFTSASLLGQAVLMFRNHLSLNRDALKLKKRLKLFGSVCTHSGPCDDILDCDVNEINICSINQSLNLVNRVVAKVNICKILLFSRETLLKSASKEEMSTAGICSVLEHDKENMSRNLFLNMLVHTWELIVKRFPSNSDDSGKDLIRFLEIFILRNICQTTKEMHNNHMKLTSLSCIEQLAKLSLLHRFDDPATLEMLHDILASLPCGDLHILVLQLLLAHSQFARTIQSFPKSSGFSQFGMIFRPMSSILRSLVFPSTDQSACSGEKSPVKRSELHVEKLSVVRLLKALLQHKDLKHGSDFGDDIGLNSKELLFLLLSSYGATLSEADLEIYKLMVAVESASESCSGSLAEMDYLWGGAAVAIRKLRKEDEAISSYSTDDPDLVDERRRSQFRENLPIDPKMCAMTVLYFPYDRTVGERTSSLNKGQQGISDGIFEGSMQTDFATGGEVQTYDPVFILRFAIHSLSLGFIEPVEFASLGLLSVAFVSLSSPDDEMRKLGYEALGRFKTALENYQKRKDIMRLRLLLTYLQNGIEEPWQRIPSVIAMFVAEASFILLDPSHDHYSTISKLLMRSSRVNMKGVPLFQNFFHSSSVDFKKDRMWILRLLYAGLNSDEDAQIYIRNNILQILLPFYASPLSDNESKELVLQIVKKSVKHLKMVHHSVKHCGMIPWLSTIVSVLCMDRGQVQQKSASTLLSTVLEIIAGVVSSQDIIEWLQKFSLEQLSELSTHLHKLLVEGGLIKETCFANPILQILMSTLKISQKRKVYQPHFTLSDEGLFHIYGFIDSNSRDISHTTEQGLNSLLMSTPPIELLCMDQVKLRKLVWWATLAALQSNLRKQAQPSATFVEEEQSEDSLISKLLRWLVASVIIGRLSCRPNGLRPDCIPEKSNLGMLLSSLEHKRKNQPCVGSEEILATVILFLQQHLGIDYRLLPSVVSALCLLLFPEFSGSAEMGCLLGNGTTLDSLLSKIRCPAEANPTWRWTFDQPWKDESSETTDSVNIDEFHACQSLLLIISNVIAKKSSLKHVLSHRDIEESGVFNWQRSLLES